MKTARTAAVPDRGRPEPHIDRAGSNGASDSTAQAAAGCLTLGQLEALIPTCTACPRLRTYCRQVAADKVKRFSDWTYWGRPVPGFGDPQAWLLVVGLAPAAHGANRTGRLFTGDRSGDFLYAALHRAGLASQATATDREDGLTLRGVYITAAGRCAPPQNRPTPQELAACRPYLQRELALLPQVRVILALGGLAYETVVRAAAESGQVRLSVRGAARPRFTHGAVHALDGWLGKPRLPLLACYHVSQQNTFTGVLTPAMLDEVIKHARALQAL